MQASPIRRVLLLALLLPGLSHAAQPETPAPAELRSWIEELKASPRGPFERIRWFCQDGSVLPPKAYACANHGGGVQHGEWNARTQALRAGGYAVANVFARIDTSPFLGAGADLALLDQILMERFLIRIDDGWIFRGARSYRGALQAEDEEAGAKALLLAMLGDAAWLEAPRYLRLREVARLLPLPRGDAATAAKVRHAALELAEKDGAFTPLRAKIHNAPDADDAAAVRAYATRKGPAGMRTAYEKLAADIDALYASGDAAETLRAAAKRAGLLGARLDAAARRIAGAGDDDARFTAIAAALTLLRDALADPALTPAQRLLVLETSLALEDDAYALGTVLLRGLGDATRGQRLARIGDTARALYGIGFLTRRHVDGVEKSLTRLGRPDLTVDQYREELRFLARGPEWSGRWLEFNFSETIAHWADLDPKAHLFNQDRLRGSPLLFYSALIDTLNRDANGLAGIEHDLFGKKIGSGLRALNPGLTRGTLVAPPGGETPVGGFSRNGVYLLPESTHDLPRVSGILTRGEGSSLSHVQLLARNLGIPNVVVGEEHVPTLHGHNGQRVVLAVSPQGVVRLVEHSANWDAIFGQQATQGGVVIRPDLEKLDLRAQMIPLSSLRASDSGRLSGPKGANLGELAHFFGDAVPPGFVISFGVFRQLLDEPIEPGGPSTWEWMKGEYPRLEALPQAEHDAQVAAFLMRLRNWIQTADPGAGFRQGLKIGLDRLGPDGSFGVFVRSDTNVEDLPGFTGAGLNLTVANVVGTDAVLEAIRDVWASPFTERAYGWRQGNMENPEYVFPAVVIQKSFPSEKSGVLVTADVDSGDRSWLTLAVNEGVGGAVEGQAAESLKIHVPSGEVRFFAQATAPRRMALSASGGVVKLPASGTSAVLTPGEIAKLVAFTRTVGERFPSLLDEEGNSLPADVEFAFKDGELTLLQIRPLVESKSAQRNTYLAELDASFSSRGAARVDLDGVPKE
ncbi:MAG: phosphoenolpyruvate synthase [Deltaproteobacteria bacterium]|nr:phosphoenolpyruvate synthase [Deltaproteobacteria bacterium]MBW2360281.1 phosphoenolpyruvate synthase [Deltaproteobacteria bacterium]